MQSSRTLGLEEAMAAIRAGIAAATRFRRRMSFVVADREGRVLGSARMDGCPARVMLHAQRKAYTAAWMERDTLAFKADLQERNGTLAEWGDPRLTTLQGGKVARFNGETVGSVATGGASVAQDEEVASVMLRALNLEPVADPQLRKPANFRHASLPLSERLIAAGSSPMVAVCLDDNVYTSGISGVDVRTGELPDDPEKQFALAFENLQWLLRSVGAGPESVGLITVFIPDRASRAIINKPWLQMYPADDRPARKTNQASLPAGVRVQLSAIAVLGSKRETVTVPGLVHKDPLPVAVRIGNHVFASVLSPEDPDTGKLVAGDTAQIARCYDNASLLMRRAGGSEDNINHAWTFLRDMSLQNAMLDEYLRRFNRESDRPARKTLAYELPPDVAIQLHITGMLGGKRTNYEVAGVGHHDPIPMGSRIGPLLQSSGIYGIEMASGALAQGFEAQLQNTVGITRALMEQAGSGPERICHMTVMLRDLARAPRAHAAVRELCGDASDAGPALHFVNYRMPPDMEVQFHVTAVLT